MFCRHYQQFENSGKSGSQWLLARKVSFENKILSFWHFSWTTFKEGEIAENMSYIKSNDKTVLNINSRLMFKTVLFLRERYFSFYNEYLIGYFFNLNILYIARFFIEPEIFLLNHIVMNII